MPAVPRKPPLNELAYRSDGSSGFNASLLPQQSSQIELGVRQWLGAECLQS